MKINKNKVIINGAKVNAYVFLSYSDLFDFVYDAMKEKAIIDNTFCPQYECQEWMKKNVENKLEIEDL